MNTIRINKMSFSYDKINVFSNFNLNICNYKSYSIIGPSSCGKSTLLKLIAGINKKFEGEIIVNENEISDMKSKNFVTYVCEDTNFLKSTLREELFYCLEKNGYNPKYIVNTVKYIEEYFNLKRLIDKKITLMNKEEVIISKLISSIVESPEILLVDDLFKWLSISFKQKFATFLKEQEIVLLNVVTDIEDVLYSEYLIVLLKNGIVAMEGQTIPVLKEEKLLKRLGFNLPFMIDLSIQLKYYGLIDQIYLNKKEMIRNIWK